MLDVANSRRRYGLRKLGGEIFPPEATELPKMLEVSTNPGHYLFR
jgi:hypothetical protein